VRLRDGYDGEVKGGFGLYYLYILQLVYNLDSLLDAGRIWVDLINGLIVDYHKQTYFCQFHYGDCNPFYRILSSIHCTYIDLPRGLVTRKEVLTRYGD
jgi:hypothetical protein